MPKSTRKRKEKVATPHRLIDAAAEDRRAQQAYAKAEAWAKAPAGTPYGGLPATGRS